MQDESTLTPFQLRLLHIGSIIVISILALITVFITLPEPISWDFIVNLHQPATMLVRGFGAYDNSTTGYPQGVWFPQIIGQFFWLGWLSIEQASVLWLSLMVICWVIGVYAILPRFNSPILLAILMITISILPSVWMHYNLGQISLYTMLLLVLIARAVESERPIIVGILLALACGKPQLILLPVIGLVIALWKLDSWNAWLKTGIAFIVTTLLLLLPLFLAEANWLDTYLTAMSDLPLWAHPTIYHILLRDTTPGIALWVFVPIALAVTAINIVLWLRLPAREAMLWSMGLNLIAIPLVWTWDFVCLFPLYAYYLFTLSTKRAKGILILTYCSLIVGFIAIHATISNEFITDWWIPIAMLLGAFLALWLDKRLTISPELSRAK